MTLSNNIAVYCNSAGEVFRVAHVARTNSEANSFCDDHPNTGVIAEDKSGLVYIAELNHTTNSNILSKPGVETMSVPPKTICISSKQTKSFLKQFTRKELRFMARDLGINRGRNKCDTIRNLRDANIPLTVTVNANWWKGGTAKPEDTKSTSKKMYCASPTVEVPCQHGGTVMQQVPTFYLHPDVQGITSEAHAARIVTGMLTTASADGVIVHPNVSLVNVY